MAESNDSGDYMSLPKPENEIGYSGLEIVQICGDRNICTKNFWKAFGINTCSMDETGAVLYYKCDVERALHILKADGGQYHLWD